ncbi:transglutaminase-like domain-containing protein [Lachnospiraceae bacterium OttesenSCG-928-E19]|nr:transglutaminase-like domain-containing protein [Lachnospiraceae bacterium OttesenSCG-928-E19]
MNLIEYYKKQSDISKISKKFADRFGDTPNEIVVQVRKKLIHPCENPYNFDDKNWPRLPTGKDIEKAFTEQQFAFGTCRAFTLACVAIMRAKGIPARGRCGFANYFNAGSYEDHWVVEYWDNGKWKLADAQKMRLNLTSGQFINGATAWKLVRNFGFDSNLFGFSGQAFQNHGLGYVIKNMIRDASGLLKSELNYLSSVSIDNKIKKLTNSDYADLDKISDMILSEDIVGLHNIDFSEFE